MTVTDTTDDRTAEAYELGCSRGWDHANFVDTYGKEHERKGPDYGSRYALYDAPTTLGGPNSRTSTERYAERAEFKRGWTDGRKRFHQGRYPDGTKIED